MSFMKKWIKIEELQKGQNMLVINWIIPKKKKKNLFQSQIELAKHGIKNCREKMVMPTLSNRSLVFLPVKCTILFFDTVHIWV